MFICNVLSTVHAVRGIILVSLTAESALVAVRGTSSQSTSIVPTETSHPTGGSPHPAANTAHEMPVAP